MTAPATPAPAFSRYRAKLLVAIMVVVSMVLAAALVFSQRNVAANAERELAQAFERELTALHALQAVRHAALAERCRALARKPRIHAALEDNALDLLYPSARDELLDVMERRGESAGYALRARFYRFLDHQGAVIRPPDERDVGPLSRAEEDRLALAALPPQVQTGYLVRTDAAGGETIDEVIVMPIQSSETGEAIAALVLGFAPFEPSAAHAGAGIRSGIWAEGTLRLPAVSAAARATLSAEIRRRMAADPDQPRRFTLEVDGVPSLIFYNRPDPHALFPPAFEVVVYPLTDSLAYQRQLLWRFGAAWAVLLLGAFGASHWLAGRLSRPVEQLAVDSEENRTQRVRAEAALELTHEELQRSARFSADASHQLKTPVTVLRVGLEELLAGEKLSGDLREEVSALVHQTFRLTSVIEDLLLLSRMDAGRLQLELAPLNLVALIEAALDDLGAQDDDLGLETASDLPPALVVQGERGYTSLILQNLLENARKYNRPAGRIRIAARPEAGFAVVTVGNTGPGIPASAQHRIFERFHRGAVGENVPGHGLGLNLARQLARLHRGDLRLIRSADDWTEFELRLLLASAPTGATVSGP